MNSADQILGDGLDHNMLHHHDVTNGQRISVFDDLDLNGFKSRYEVDDLFSSHEHSASYWPQFGEPAMASDWHREWSPRLKPLQPPTLSIQEPRYNMHALPPLDLGTSWAFRDGKIPGQSVGVEQQPYMHRSLPPLHDFYPEPYVESEYYHQLAAGVVHHPRSVMGTKPNSTSNSSSYQDPGISLLSPATTPSSSVAYQSNPISHSILPSIDNMDSLEDMLIQLNSVSQPETPHIDPVYFQPEYSTTSHYSSEMSSIFPPLSFLTDPSLQYDGEQHYRSDVYPSDLIGPPYSSTHLFEGLPPVPVSNPIAFVPSGEKKPNLGRRKSTKSLSSDKRRGSITGYSTDDSNHVIDSY